MRRGSVTLRRNSSQNEKAGRDERIRLSNVTYVQRLLRPLGDIDVIAAGDAGVELARTADFLMRVLDHLAPLADPADGAGDREQHGEHRGRETHRLQRDARIEVDVRIELALDEI